MRRKGQSGEGETGTIFGLLILVLIVWWGYNTFIKQDTWMAFYETPSSQLPGTREFDSKNDCLNWIRDQQLSPGDRYNFECGSNCRPSDGIGVYRCEETFD